MSRPSGVSEDDAGSAVAGSELSPLQVELRDRHRDFYLDLAERAAAAWRHERDQWLPVLVEELSNLRAALSWSIGRRDREKALRLCTALSALWAKRRLLREAVDAFDAALALDGADGEVVFSARIAFGEVLWAAGRYRDAIAVLEPAAELEDPAGDRCRGRRC